MVLKLINLVAEQGYTNKHVNENQYDFLTDQGIPRGQLNEMWYKYLTSLSLTGSLTDMIWQVEGLNASLQVTLESDNTAGLVWEGTLDSIVITGGTSHDGTYTTFYDSSALAFTSLAGVAGKMLSFLDTTGSTEVGSVLTLGGYIFVYDSTQPVPSVSVQWQRDGVDIVGAVGTSYTTVVADGGADVRPVLTFSASGQTDVVVNGSAVSVATSTLTRQRLVAGWVTNNVNAATTSYNINTSAMSAGDWIILTSFDGVRTVTSATVNGNAASILGAAGNATFVNQQSVLRYQLQSGDIGATIPIVINLNTTGNVHALDAWGFKNGVPTLLNDVEGTSVNNTVGLSATNTVTNANNMIMGFVGKLSHADLSYNSTMTEIEQLDATINSTAVTVATAAVDDVATGSATVTAIPAATSQMSLIAILIE